MERVLDQQGRWRNKVVAFRMSPEEDKVLEAKVKLSGLTKQEYIIRRLTDREITVVGNPRVYKALRGQMELIYQELQRLAVDEEVSPDLRCNANAGQYKNDRTGCICWRRCGTVVSQN